MTSLLVKSTAYAMSASLLFGRTLVVENMHKYAPAEEVCAMEGVQRVCAVFEATHSLLSLLGPRPAHVMTQIITHSHQVTDRQTDQPSLREGGGGVCLCHAWSAT